MGDKEARALGAGDTIEVRGKEYRMEPVTMRPLAEVQKLAVKHYRRQYLEGLRENLDLAGMAPKHIDQHMMQKVEEASRWDVSDLPPKFSYSSHGVKVTDKLRQLLKTKLKDDVDEFPTEETRVRSLLETALDSGTVTSDEVQKASGTRPRRASVPFDTWWITADYEGMIAFVWASVNRSHPELTRDDVAGWPFEKIVEAARLAESLTAPAAGNT